MAERIAAEEGALREGQNAVREAKESIDGRLSTIRNLIGELGGYWSGDAATAFNALMTAWDEKSSKLNNILVDLENSLRQTEQSQARDEENVQSTTSRLQSLLG